MVAANRIVDMEEMWRQRDLENNARRDKSSRETRDERFEVRSADRDYHAERMNLNEEGSDTSSSDQDDGLKDEDIEKFLHSRYGFSSLSLSLSVTISFFCFFFVFCTCP